MLTIHIGVKTPLGRELVAPFTLSINHGDKIAIIGEEGNGKSLYLKSILNIADPELYVERSLSHTKTVFGYLAQDLSTEILSMSAREYLIGEEWDRYQKLDVYLHQHLSHFNDEDLDRSMSSFSGGERVKIQIIRMLLQDADCFLLDEPTNDIDLNTILWLEDWIQAQSKPVVFISHDTRLLQHTANRIVHFEQTHRKTRSKITVFEGNYDSYVAKRYQHITTHNKNVENQRALKAKQMDRWRRLYQQVDHKLGTISRQAPSKGRLLKKKMAVVKSMEKRFDREKIADKIDQEEAISLRFNEMEMLHHKKLLEIDVKKLKIAGKTLGHDYYLDIYSHDKIAILGPNGCGKSTLLKQVFDDEFFMHQDYRLNLDYNKSPIDNCIDQGSRDERTQVINHLGSLKFTETEMNTPMRDLSGGQKAKVSLLKLVLKNPPYIILDESTRNLSPLSQDVIHTMLKSYRGAIVCVTHDRALIEEVFDSVYEFTKEGFVELD